MKSDVSDLIGFALAVGLLWLCSILSQFRQDLIDNSTLEKLKAASESIEKIQGKINESWIFRDDGRRR